jgi:hypothetical protein
MAQPTHIVLIDCENVQPKDLLLLQGGPFSVKLFLGQNQTKIPVEWAAALQPISDVEYITLSGAGPNALDFHIAYCLGDLSCREPAAHFHIISKDKGFDPLIKHLRDRNVHVRRSACIGEIPCFGRPKLSPTVEAQIETVIADLDRRKSAKPKKLKTLLGTIDALFKKKTSEAQLRALVDALSERGFIQVDGDKISYRLPSRAA